jgi:hypothetical protein
MHDMRLFAHRLRLGKNVQSVEDLNINYKVLIYEEEAKRIANYTLQYPDRETGGSLFGYWSHTGSPIVAFISGPGKGSQHNRTSFFQNENYLFNLGTELYDRHGLQHIGEWHSHHKLGLNEPSTGDINTILSGIEKQNWPRFLLLITTIDRKDLVLKNYFLFLKNNTKPSPLKILTLSGFSPFRNKPYNQQEEDFRPPPYTTWQPGPFTPGTLQNSKSEPKKWYSTREGMDILLKIKKEFEEVGMSCEVFIDPKKYDNVELQLKDDKLFLSPEFPSKAPEWENSAKPKQIKLWSPTSNIANWYLLSKESK